MADLLVEKWLHCTNRAFLLCIAPGKITHIFCLTYAVERVALNMSESLWKCLLLVANMVDLLSYFLLWQAWNQIMSNLTRRMGLPCSYSSISLHQTFLLFLCLYLGLWVCAWISLSADGDGDQTGCNWIFDPTWLQAVRFKSSPSDMQTSTTHPLPVFLQDGQYRSLWACEVRSSNREVQDCPLQKWRGGLFSLHSSSTPLCTIYTTK